MFTIIPPRSDLTDQNAAIDINDLYKNTEYFYDAIRVTSGKVKIASAGKSLVLGDAALVDTYMQVRDNNNIGTVQFGLDASLNGGAGGGLIQTGGNKSFAIAVNSDTFGSTPSFEIDISGKISTGGEVNPDVVPGGIHIEIDNTTAGDVLLIKDGTIKYFGVDNEGFMICQGKELLLASYKASSTQELSLYGTLSPFVNGTTVMLAHGTWGTDNITGIYESGTSVFIQFFNGTSIDTKEIRQGNATAIGQDLYIII